MRSIALAVLASATLGHQAQAQAVVRKPVIRLHAGLTAPSQPSEFADAWKTGFNLGGSIGYPVTPAVSLEASLVYNAMGFDLDGFLKSSGFFSPTIIISGAGASIISATANVVARMYNPTSRVAPYFTGGLGMIRFGLGDVTITEPTFGTETFPGTSETATLFEFGLGMEVRGGVHTGFFAEARYGIGLTSGQSTQFLPIKLGVVIR